MTEILVVGDVMLDRYWFGTAERISQEAPVPVVKMSREECRMGAAANVAANCRAMGAEAKLISIVGDDESGRHLQGLLSLNGIPYQHSTDASMPTTQKLRVIGKQQQVVRVDIEDAPTLSTISAMEKAIDYSDANVIVFSDYGKGALKNVGRLITLAKKAGKTVLVDPKGHDYARYCGADLIKPNIDEMRALVGGWDSEETLADKAQQLLKDGEFRAILLTRAAAGMTLYQAAGYTHVPSVAREVFDVTGAGDTAIAAFAVAVMRGHDFISATKCANKAAGISVGRFGTTTVSQQEVFGA